MKFGSILAAVAALATTAAVTAQVAPATAPAASPFALTLNDWTVTENVTFNTFKEGGNTLVGLDTTLSLNLTKDIDVSLSAPVYTQGDHSSFGDLNLGGSWDLFGGSNSTIGKWGFSVDGGIYIPMGAEFFRSQNVNPYIGAAFDCKVWELDFTQTAQYRFDGGYAYIPVLGAQTDSDLLSFGSTLGYKWSKFEVGAKFDQYYYVNAGETQLFLGPTAKWDISSDVSLNGSVLLPVYQDVSTPEANVLIGAGLTIKF